MSRYIDADKLKKAWYTKHNITEEDCGACFVGYSELPRLIDNAPTADVVEVVRCKDCKYYVLHTFYGRTQGWCERLCDEFDKSLAHGTEGDDFCSFGERADT